MSNFEDLRLCDLLKKVKEGAEDVMRSGNASSVRELGGRVQSVYDFVLTAEGDFATVQENIKNVFSSFNYAAVLVNDGIKNGKLTKDDDSLIYECMEVIVKTCNYIQSELLKK